MLCGELSGFADPLTDPSVGSLIVLAVTGRRRLQLP